MNRNLNSVIKENKLLRNFGDDKTQNLNFDFLKQKANSLRNSDIENMGLEKKIKKIKEGLQKRREKKLDNGLKSEKKKLMSKKIKGIKGMRVTPKLEFKTIPDALNSRTVPLDSKLYNNSKMDSNDPRTVKDISKDIIRYLKCIECIYKPQKQFLKFQKFVSKEQREKQIDWVLRLSHEMRLKRQTFYLAVSMIDRFIELRKVTNSEEYDKVALTCLFSAAKYEELTFPTINDFVYLSGGGATKEDLINQEMQILETLGWRLNHCNPMTFFDQMAKGLNLRPPCYHFGQFLVECLIYKGESCKYNNSIIGVSCLLLALIFYDKRDFSEEKEFWRRIQDESLYTKEEVKSAAEKIWEFVKTVFSRKEEERSAVIQKFKKKYYSKISGFLNFELKGL